MKGKGTAGRRKGERIVCEGWCPLNQNSGDTIEHASSLVTLVEEESEM
jgi:hypothetical protein